MQDTSAYLVAILSSPVILNFVVTAVFLDLVELSVLHFYFKAWQPCSESWLMPQPCALRLPWCVAEASPGLSGKEKPEADCQLCAASAPMQRPLRVSDPRTSESPPELGKKGRGDGGSLLRDEQILPVLWLYFPL